jgi:hypothetical protein
MKERLALLGVACVAGISLAAISGASNQAAPKQYLYTGWVEAAPGVPNRYFTEGDAFYSAFRYLGQSATYRVCWQRVGGGYTRCWTRNVKNGRVSRFNATLRRPESRFGAYVAKWSVGGTVVATWNFYFDSEGV